jgi:hypothetical protein
MARKAVALTSTQVEKGAQEPTGQSGHVGAGHAERLGQPGKGGEDRAVGAGLGTRNPV